MLKHTEYIEVAILDAPPTTSSPHALSDLSKRRFVARIVDDLSGKRAPRPAEYTEYKTWDPGERYYTIRFDLPDDQFYINPKYHHIALRGCTKTTDNMDMVVILCDREAVAETAHGAAYAAAYGKFVVCMPDDTLVPIVPSEVIPGVKW